MDGAVEAIRKRGWRQGSIFPKEAHEAISRVRGTPAGEGTCYIVLSQSCDVVHGDLKAEPTVEVLAARRLAGSKKDGNYTFGKNARCLHFDVDEATVGIAHEVLARERFHVPRSLLSEFAPDGNRALSPESVSLLVRWVVARFSRTAFPDAFNDRLSAHEKKLKKALASLDEVESLYLALDTWDELPPDQPYRIALVGVLRAEDAESAEARQRAEHALGELVACINRCAGLVVDDHELRADSEMTLRDARYHARWYLDAISLKNPEHKVAPPTR